MCGAGKASGIFCSMHKAEGMVDVRNKHCLHPDCNKCPSFNYAGKTPGIYCGLHKLPGMIDVKHKRSHLSEFLKRLLAHMGEAQLKQTVSSRLSPEN